MFRIAFKRLQNTLIPALALAALTALAAVEPAHAASLRPTAFNPATPASALSVSITTGDDDVRKNSTVIVYAMVQQGNAVNKFSVNMNNGGNWPNGSTNGGTLQLPPGTTLGDIRSVGVHFDSGSSGPFDSPDNWNMQSITITYGQGSVLVNQAGTPLWRFKGGNEQDWQLGL